MLYFSLFNTYLEIGYFKDELINFLNNLYKRYDECATINLREEKNFKYLERK